MQTTLKKLTKRLFLTAVIAALFVTTATIAYANAVYHVRTDASGETFWLSCGSSAGNYFALCPADGGVCTVDQGYTQQEADYQCSQRGHYMDRTAP
jgi:hypothetical protein